MAARSSSSDGFRISIPTRLTLWNAFQGRVVEHQAALASVSEANGDDPAGFHLSDDALTERAVADRVSRGERRDVLARRYARVEDDGRLMPATDLHVGDCILVTLDLQVRRRATFVALEDPLPGVFEPLNPAFKSQETLAGETLGTDWISSYQEMRQDRVVFFSDLLYPGRYSVRYLARVVAAGEALAPSAKIQEMYHPERFGSAETQKISTAPLK